MTYLHIARLEVNVGRRTELCAISSNLKLRYIAAGQLGLGGADTYAS